MTSFSSINAICAVCGQTSEQTVLRSTNSFGSSDLDTRPPEMARSTIYVEVQTCPHCGYCCWNIEENFPQASEIIGSEAYQAQLNHPDFPELANQFLCSALLLEQTNKLASSGWMTLKAAWVCDDAGNEVAARQNRLQAARLFERSIAAGEPITEQTGAEDVILTDIYRRAGDFAAAKASIERAHNKQLEDILSQILLYQNKLIEASDSQCHTIEEALQ